MVTNDSFVIGGLKTISKASTAADNTSAAKPNADYSTSSPGVTETKPSEAMGQQEFLTLLVNQLQQQDPLNPMESEEFAVQLAQFTQVEQLISINEKLDASSAGGGNSVASMASFLGTEVALGGSQVSVAGGMGNNLFVDIPGGTQSVRVDLRNESGQVVGAQTMDNLAYGAQTLPLSGLDVPDGKYDVRVVSVDQNGKFVDLDPKITGTVEGFVLEPEPMLLVGGQEIALNDVTAVYKGK